MSLDDFKRAYRAGGSAYRRQAEQWSYRVIFLLALVVTLTVTRIFALRWYASLFVMVAAFSLFSLATLLAKKFLTKSPPA